MSVNIAGTVTGYEMRPRFVIINLEISEGLQLRLDNTSSQVETFHLWILSRGNAIAKILNAYFARYSADEDLSPAYCL